MLCIELSLSKQKSTGAKSNSGCGHRQLSSLAAPFIGFIAVGALLSALSFRMLLTPYGFGFRDEITVRRATLAAFEVLTLFIVLRLIGGLLPVLAVFEAGALFLGSLIGYMGLLILSNRWYEREYDKKYWAFQGVAIIAGVGALFFGSVFHIGELQKIGGTFFVVYCLEKLIELPTRSRPAFASLMAMVGIITICFCWFALTHQGMLQQFLLVPG